jgi:hypothetical protein
MIEILLDSSLLWQNSTNSGYLSTFCISHENSRLILSTPSPDQDSNSPDTNTATINQTIKPLSILSPSFFRRNEHPSPPNV